MSIVLNHTIVRARGPAASQCSGSDSFERQPRIEAAQVVAVARHDDGPFATRDQDDRRIDHIGGAGAPAKDPRRFGEHLIERRHERRRSFQKGAQRRVARAAPPGLAEHTRGDDQPNASPTADTAPSSCEPSPTTLAYSLPGQGDKLARNHRKIVVVDGRVAFTGGFGIRDSWLGDGVTNESWRDASVRFVGPAVSSAQQAFAEKWQESGGALLPASDVPAAEPSGPALAGFVSSTISPVLTRA